MITATLFRYFSADYALPNTWVLANASYPSYIIALKSTLTGPTVVATSKQHSLVFTGIVFQFVKNINKYIIHSQWCGSEIGRDTCALKIRDSDGRIVFSRQKSDMTHPMEEWTFSVLPSRDSPIAIQEVQPILKDIYVKTKPNQVNQLIQNFEQQVKDIINTLQQNPAQLPGELLN